MRIFLFVTTFVCLILIVGGEALACDCMTPPPKECFRRADVVFEGEVVRASRSSEGAKVYTFKVNKVLKGPDIQEVTIVGTGWNCDANFDLDVVYRVYAREYEGKLRSGQCSGNQVLRRKPRIRGKNMDYLSNFSTLACNACTWLTSRF